MGTPPGWLEVLGVTGSGSSKRGSLDQFGPSYGSTSLAAELRRCCASEVLETEATSEELRAWRLGVVGALHVLWAPQVLWATQRATSGVLGDSEALAASLGLWRVDGELLGVPMYGRRHREDGVLWSSMKLF